jgi:hypothetical protein
MPVTPDQIISERDAILDRLIADFESRHGCLALFIRGSIPQGTSDAWSDIDATAVITPAEYDRFIADRFTAPSRWGELLYNSGATMGPFLCISHFRPFVKLDLFYWRPEDLHPSPHYALPLRVAFDKDGTISKLIEASRHLRFTADPTQVNASINQAISCAHEVLRRVERGELAYAQHILGELRVFAADADAYLSRRPPASLSHFESRCADQAVLQAVQRSFPCSHTPGALLESVRQLVQTYRVQVSQIDQLFDLRRDPQRDRECFDLVENWPTRAAE